MSKPSIQTSNVAEVKASEAIVNMRLARKAGVSVIITSNPGIGKSQLCKQLSSMLNIGYLVEHALYAAPENLKFPMVDHKLNTVRFVVPGCYPTISNIESGRVPEAGIMVIEELLSAVKANQASYNEMLLDHSINNEPLGPLWSIIGTGNPRSSKGVSHEMPSHTASRLCHLLLTFDIDEWCDWAFRTGDVAGEVVAYFRNNPSDITEFNPSTWIPGTPYGCPRSAETLSRLLKANGGTLSHSQAVMTVGEGVGTRFKAFIDLAHKMINLDECIMSPKDAPLPEEPALCHAVTCGLAKRADEKNFANILRYIDRMDKFYEAYCVKDAIKSNPKLCNTKAFITWSVENHDIICG